MIKSAWPGMDFQTADSGLDRLLSSYVGAPYQVRSTDPAPYAQDAVAWWQATGTPYIPATEDAPVTPAGLMDGAAGVWDDVRAGAHTLAQSTALAILALLIITVGLLFLWKA